MTKLVRYWLADRLEGLAIRLNGGMHGRPCKGDCNCFWTGWERGVRPL